jgi:hypothetical protein
MVPVMFNTATLENVCELFLQRVSTTENHGTYPQGSRAGSRAEAGLR